MGIGSFDIYISCSGWGPPRGGWRTDPRVFSIAPPRTSVGPGTMPIRKLGPKTPKSPPSKGWGPEPAATKTPFPQRWSYLKSPPPPSKRGFQRLFVPFLVHWPRPNRWLPTSYDFWHQKNTSRGTYFFRLLPRLYGPAMSRNVLFSKKPKYHPHTYPFCSFCTEFYGYRAHMKIGSELL